MVRAWSPAKRRGPFPEGAEPGRLSMEIFDSGSLSAPFSSPSGGMPVTGSRWPAGLLGCLLRVPQAGWHLERINSHCCAHPFRPSLSEGKAGFGAFHHEVPWAPRGCWEKSFLGGPGAPCQGLSHSSIFPAHRDFGDASPKALLSNHIWGSFGNFICLGQGLGVREERI